MRAMGGAWVVCSVVAWAGCDGSGVTLPSEDAGRWLGDGGTADGESPPMPPSSEEGCATASALAGEGEACCPSLGADACGAGLFCASFDGRTISTCYPERSRLTGESCGADRHCEHGSCNLERGACRAGEDEACTRTLGCAASDEGGRQVCMTPRGSDAGRCEPNTGGSFARCTADEDCLDGTCTLHAGQCGHGRRGDWCDDGLDCVEGRCIENTCQGGEHGDRCLEDADCDAGRCAGGVCVDGRAGDPCASGSDCAGTFCNLATRRCGDACVRPAACESGLVCTRLGQCVPPGAAAAFEPCTRDDECLSGSCYPYGWRGEGACAPLGYDGTACENLITGCAEGFVCDGGRCGRMHDRICGFDAGVSEAGFRGECAGRYTCSPVSDFRNRCESDQARLCASDADCGDSRCGLFYSCR